MPSYTFNCKECGEFNIFQNINDSLPTKCLSCGSNDIKRIYKPVIPIWKCDGSYNARIHKGGDK